MHSILASAARKIGERVGSVGGARNGRSAERSAANEVPRAAFRGKTVASSALLTLALRAPAAR